MKYGRAALTARRADEGKAVVVAPHHVFKRTQRRKVLKEEEYLSTLGAILRRDFFPTLDKLEAQYEYLSAMERDDFEELKEAAARLTALEVGSGSGRVKYEAPNMCLDEFQARYVTEDTADFEELLAKLNETKLTKYRKIFKVDANALPSSQTLLLTADPVKSKGSLGVTQADNTRLEKEVELGILERDPSDIRYHYWRMLKEHGSNVDDDREPSVSGASQMGAVGRYEFVETPYSGSADHIGGTTQTPLVSPSTSQTPRREFRIPPTPDRDLLAYQMASKAGRRPHTKADLLKSPAVQRLLRAHTPKIGSVFDPKTPQRKNK